MPPLKGIDRGLSGRVLKALEEAGHGKRINIVDPSYDIPEGAQVVDYRGPTTASALAGILALVPTDDGEVLLMGPDAHDEACPALADAMQVAQKAKVGVQVVQRAGDSEAAVGNPAHDGFYEVANGAESALFVRTADEQAFACASFVVGHSQE